MIEVANLSKEYGQRRAVQDLTFQVSPGEVYALLVTAGTCQGESCPIRSQS